MLSEAAVLVEGLRVVRGHRRVLHDLTFAVPPGSVTGLLGPSGSGKTTLLRSIVGVQRVSAGSVRVLGRPAGDPRLRRRVAYMTQAPSVYGDLTVEENLTYFASVLGAARGRVGEVSEQVDLGPQRATLVARLSGGQRARVSLATALLGEPQLLVLDEPTVGLDPVLRRDLWRLFHELAASGATLLIASHVMDEAARCDRLLLLRDGTLLADDEPAALLRRTRADDLEGAFLALVESAPAAQVA